MTSSPASTRPISTLVGHGGVPLALRCLGSLSTMSAAPVAFQIHDDGTLTGDDLSRLREALPVAAIIGREEADLRARERLRGFPACLRYRERHVLALKLFDVVFFAQGDAVAYVDTDVLFLKRFAYLWPVLGDDEAGIFMQDHQPAYALRPWHLPLLGRIRLPKALNTGVFLWKKEAWDPDLLEWFLGRNWAVFERFPFWLEQTCWAVLAGRVATRSWDRTQVVVVKDAASLTPAVVAAHFTSPVRALLPLEAETAGKAAGPDGLKLRHGRAPRISMAGFAVAGAQRFLRRRLPAGRT